MKLLDDTQPEARRVLIDAYRRMSPARKWQIVEDAFQRVRLLHASGFRLRHPSASAAEIHDHWLQSRLGHLPPRELAVTHTMNESLQVLREVLQVFRDLSIDYAIGGSMASSLYGVPRQTDDADITVAPFPGREAKFAARFGEDYYVALESIRQAMHGDSSFNIIHLPTGFKIDAFVLKDRPFEMEAFKRRREHALTEATGDRVVVLSPEDVILFKLDWYRIGAETSDRQWSDILGVLRVQAGRLDETYLDHWANELSLNDLLRRVREQV